MAVNRVKDAVNRGWRDCIHFVDYDILVREPGVTLQEIYKFFNLEPFKHQFKKVEQVTTENDDVHGFGAPLHAIRPKVEPQEPQWPEVLGAAADAYARDAHFWKKL